MCWGSLSRCDSNERTVVTLLSFEREAPRHMPGSGTTELPEALLIRKEIPSALLCLCLQPAQGLVHGHCLSAQSIIQLGRTSQHPNGPIDVHLLPPDLMHGIALKPVKEISRC